MANYKGIWRGGKPSTDEMDHGHHADWQDGGSDGQQAKQDDAAHGHGEDITDEEASEIGNLMNDEDDPEGWMSELVDYWEQLPPTSSLTRKEWLQHRVEAAKAFLASHRMGSFEFWPTASRRNCHCDCDGAYSSESKAVDTSDALRRESESFDGSGQQGCNEDGGAATAGYACQ